MTHEEIAAIRAEAAETAQWWNELDWPALKDFAGQMVPALCDELEAAQKEVEKLRGWVDDLRYALDHHEADT